MGQVNTKTDQPAPARANSPREFRESFVNTEASDTSATDVERDSVKANLLLPTITVADYSGPLSAERSTPVEKEVFYDFEHENSDYNNRSKRDLGIAKDGVDITVIDDDHDHDADPDVGRSVDSGLFYDTTGSDQHNKWQIPNNGILSHVQMRHNHVKLEDVPEEDDDHDKDEDEDADEESNEDEDEDEDEDEEDDEDATKTNVRTQRHLDNELYDSGECSPSKSVNTSDTTLSGSPSDSGIGVDSQPTTPSAVKTRLSPTTAKTQHQQQQRQQQQQYYSHLPFVRDSNSTDCDEMLLPCDDLDYLTDGPHERLVCIESISLPDVVVESTTASTGTSSSASGAALSPASSTTSGEHIININGASGNSMGNVHFIPIHLEGSNNNNNNNNNGGTKRRSIDDSVLGGGVGTKKMFSQMNGYHQSTIEIVEDASVTNNCDSNKGYAEQLK